MSKRAYGHPILINDTKNSIAPITKTEAFDEDFVQGLIFRHPEVLPIHSIDQSYTNLTPVCRELNTSAGPMDLFMVSPTGQLCVVETKLWRNPEARRKVIAQILDYAKALSSWKYEDLQRETSRKLNRKGNAIYELIASAYPEEVLSESDFVDEVSRNLERGKMLLIIAGDGIREGTEGIADFLTYAGNLNFTFALVELNMYTTEDQQTLVVPNTLAKTVEFPKMSISLPKGLSIVVDESSVDDSGDVDDPAKERESNFYREFWSEFTKELVLDDPSQPIPNGANAQNLFLYLGESKDCWVSAYFMKSNKRVGVYFRVANNERGEAISALLDPYYDDIKRSLGDDAVWSTNDNITSISYRLSCEDVFNPRFREEIKLFFSKKINLMVSTIGPLLKRG